MTTQHHFVRGRWYRDGYRQDRTRIPLAVIGGIAYDPTQACAPLDETEMRINADGDLTAWLHATFAPDAGDLDRLARAGVTFRRA